MFKTITRLFFGGEEETPEDVKSGEVVEEGWLVVNHQEPSSSENEVTEPADTQPSNSALHEDIAVNMESDISVLDPELAVQSSSSSLAVTAPLPHPKDLLEETQLSCNKKTWVDPHHMSRNAIQRQNRVRTGVQHHAFHLQQPAHRNLSH
ncbi:hypothetical protein OYC64_011145 [Pagothenia borchgrevinki]|uniref:Tumor protein p53-inducible nuclear protein 1 n=1 Tax=Pagothenia borchgrevinki TaxID=8213 RepID=A0ABD2H127_PAGBO